MFDLVALAVLKHEHWGTAERIPAPTLVGECSNGRANQEHTIVIWDRFDLEAIIQVFFEMIDLSTKP